MTSVERAEEATDADLVRAAGAGDKEAFGALVLRHRPLAVAVSRRMLKDSDLALDAVQEATITALVGLGRLRSPERFGAWYAGIALNVSRRMLRGLSRRGRPVSALWPDTPMTPEEHAEAGEMSVLVRQAVDGLPRGQREAVLAFYWRGLNHAEAAAGLGISRGAVKTRLHDARIALAPRLAGAGASSKEAAVSSKDSKWVTVVVSEVRSRQGSTSAEFGHVVVLREQDESRLLPIWVGPAEATMIACTLQAVEFPRPMTYELAAGLLKASGSTLSEVRITRLAESTYYAVVEIEATSGPAEVDARPSDAINLALVCEAPIKVESSLLETPESLAGPEWQELESGAADLADDVRRRQAELQEMLSRYEPR